MPLILASTSPRRKQLLSWLEINFKVVPSAFDESLVDCEEPDELVEELALQKALSISNKYPNQTIIGADTTVYVNGHSLGKAENKRMAKAMLQELSGTTHQVYTGVAIIDLSLDERIVFHEVSDVIFRQLEQSEIDQLLELDIWHDKAGAYAIQEDPIKAVLGYQGSFTNIIGLPLPRLADELEGMGYEISVNIPDIILKNTGRREK